jgi:hypothetical protein
LVEASRSQEEIMLKPDMRFINTTVTEPPYMAKILRVIHNGDKYIFVDNLYFLDPSRGYRVTKVPTFERGTYVYAHSDDMWTDVIVNHNGFTVGLADGLCTIPETELPLLILKWPDMLYTNLY